jgi:uncharacterized protein (TIGR02246 family)
MDTPTARALVEQAARAWERADLDAIVAPFAADGIFISPGGRWQGHAAIRAAAQAFFAVAGDVEVTIGRVVADGAVGAAEWSWSEREHASGARRTFADAIVFEVRDGLVVYWREYFDPAAWR